MTEEEIVKKRKKAEKIRKSRKRQLKRMTFLAVEIVIFLLLAGITFVMAKYDKFQTVYFGEDDIQTNPGIKMEGYMTVALFGGDSREGLLEAGTHADTIILASINNDTKDVRLVSIYRDTLTEQMDDKIKKANYAYFKGGPKDAINMLNKNFDLNIENYVTVDFKAVSDVIDLLGGIEVDVTDAEAAEMNNYIGETAASVGKEAKLITTGGKQHLDGVQAVTYARIRKNVGGDYKRTERQRIVISKVVEKAKKMKLSTVNKIINKVFSQISTNFSLPDMISLASGAFGYNLGDTTSFPFESISRNVSGVGSSIIPVGFVENVQELHQFLYPDQKIKEPSEKIHEISDRIESMTGITRENLETEVQNVVQNEREKNEEEKAAEEQTEDVENKEVDKQSK